MSFLDEYKILIGGYFGVCEMDEYVLKEYVLQDIEKYIIEFISKEYYEINYQEIANDLKDNLSLKRKLQDSLLTLRKIDGPFELEHMIKLKLEEIKKDN